MRRFFPRSILGYFSRSKGAFTPDVKSLLNEILGGILGVTQC
jgi:hypothetical protein